QFSEQQATYINLIGPYTPNFLVAIGMLSQSLYYQVSFLITFSSFLPDECAQFPLDQCPPSGFVGCADNNDGPTATLRIDMEYFLEYVLVTSFDGEFPRPVLVMYNARVHHGGRITQIPVETTPALDGD
ncbi:hypothetical protein VP01_5686g2, partial [Puccinia sorghi]